MGPTANVGILVPHKVQTSIGIEPKPDASDLLFADRLTPKKLLGWVRAGVRAPTFEFGRNSTVGSPAIEGPRGGYRLSRRTGLPLRFGMFSAPAERPLPTILCRGSIAERMDRLRQTQSSGKKRFKNTLTFHKNRNESFPPFLSGLRVNRCQEVRNERNMLSFWPLNDVCEKRRFSYNVKFHHNGPYGIMDRLNQVPRARVLRILFAAPFSLGVTVSDHFAPSLGRSALP